MKAIILPDYNSNIVRAMRSLSVGELSIPEPTGGDVLVKVMAAPCNPSDIAFMRGGYGVRKPVPVVMGFECTGMVIESGPEPEARALLGKKVSCFSQETANGTWSEYFLTGHHECLTIKDDLPVEQAAAFCINPFTAYALLDTAKDKQARAIIQNGASGQIGIFIRRMADLNGIKVINLVRKEEHIQDLKDEGETHVLSMNDPEFETKLGHMSRELGAMIAFDAVGGDTSGSILNAMPEESELVIYGGLSNKPAGMFNTLDIIFKGKSIKGFNLTDWRKEVGEEKYRQVSLELQDMITAGIIRTRIQGGFALEEVQQALEQYIRNMSSGKILFLPDKAI